MVVPGTSVIYLTPVMGSLSSKSKTVFSTQDAYQKFLESILVESRHEKREKQGQ